MASFVPLWNPLSFSGGSDWQLNALQSLPRRTSHHLLTPKDAGPGIVAHLKLDAIPSYSMYWNNKDRANDSGADNHPTVIVGTRSNGRIATCLQMTSFGATTLEEKYWNPSNPIRLHHLAIDQGNNTTTAPNDLPVLQLKDGLAMEKQSYVKLDMFFEIETQYLVRWRSGDRQLTQASLLDLQQQFRRFLAGKIPRLPPAPGRPVSPLAIRSYTPEQLGVPASPSRLPAMRTGPGVGAGPAELYNRDTGLPAPGFRAGSGVPAPH